MLRNDLIRLHVDRCEFEEINAIGYEPAGLTMHPPPKKND